MFNCPKKKEAQQKGDSKPALLGNACQEVAWNEESEKYLKWGKLEGRSAQMLIDSGCSLTMVSADCVEPSKINSVKKVRA